MLCLYSHVKGHNSTSMDPQGTILSDEQPPFETPRSVSLGRQIYVSTINVSTIHLFVNIAPHISLFMYS